MKNVFLNRAAWMAGISALALLSACGGGGSGTAASPTGAEALNVKNAAVWAGESPVTSITLAGDAVQIGTVVRISEWTCTSEDPRGLNQPQATENVEVLVTSTSGTVFSDVRVPATKLLVTVMNGSSVYYAKRHDMATAGDDKGNLTIALNLSPNSEESMAAQFDKCP